MKLVSVIHRYETVLLAVNYESWTFDSGHLFQIVKHVTDQIRKPWANFCRCNTPYACERWHQNESSNFVSAGQVGSGSTPDRPTKKHNVQRVYFMVYQEFVNSLRVWKDSRLWSILMWVDSITRILHGYNVQFKCRAQVVKKLIRHTNVFSISVEEKHHFWATFAR